LGYYFTMRILVTGALGLLGKEISSFKQNDFEIIALSHKDIELTNQTSADEAISKYKPDAIINTAVIVSVDKCEADEKLCFDVNTRGVEYLIYAFQKSGARGPFIQISSSEVFGRVREGEYKIEGYSEEEKPMPVSAYQRSKTEAEEIVKMAGEKQKTPWYVVRAGWLYGKGRETFVEQFIKKLQEEKEVEVIVDQWRSPTWTGDFVKSLFDLIKSKRESGIYHIAPDIKVGEATTMDVINEISEFLGKKAKATYKMVKRDSVFKVPRAPSNVILNTKLPKLPYWRDSLRNYLQSLYN